MPAPVTSSAHVSTTEKSSTVKPRKQLKKTRIVRRRGRGPGDIESDDEIERELATDSGSEDELSSLDSDSDSDTEAVSEDVLPNVTSRAFTPGTSQSPGDTDSQEKGVASTGPFFSASGNWSEMVNDENTNGPADLPVIEFTDFDGQNFSSPSPHHKRQKKAPKPSQTRPTVPASSSQPNGHQSSNETEVTQHTASTSRSPGPSFTRRPPGQSARQAYQQRLESDPSYVPTVGGFWGHDDRLLDKDLRSLSGWWRGRWQGYGRGNGFIRGRGRAGFMRAPVNRGDEPQLEEGFPNEVPPIEREWTHDGFEEMRQREEHRRAAQHMQSQNKPQQGSGNFRGGRGLPAARGGRGGVSRGGFTSPVERPSTSGRIWFSKKPELMWTKQYEGFLYFELDPALKPRQGQGQGIQVKLPGKQPKVVRAPPRSHRAAKGPSYTSNESNTVAPDHYTVNLPKPPRKEKHTEGVVPAHQKSNSTSTSGIATTSETVTNLFVESITVDPLVIIPQEQPNASPSHGSDTLTGTSSKSHQEASIRLQLEQLSPEQEQPDPARLARTEEAVLKNPSTELPVEDRPAYPAQPENEGHLAMPVLPTVYSPPLPQPSPVYSSSYGYPPALPPGIAMNPHGMAYEVATGRPVYLQAPPPIYNPRPIIPSHPASAAFAPGHITHHSLSHSHSTVSPDFPTQSAPHTPPVNGFIDPSTGTPIFAFPRQTSRIEIRAPDGNPVVKSPSKPSAPRSSGLRTTATAFEPSRPSSDSPSSGYFPMLTATENGVLPSYVPAEGAEGSADTPEGLQHDQAMMAYPHYPQHYYYPDAYGYLHNPYMDMSHVRPYEMYPSHEGTVYY